MQSVNKTVVFANRNLLKMIGGQILKLKIATFVEGLQISQILLVREFADLRNLFA
jgi:hypothetical protein